MVDSGTRSAAGRPAWVKAGLALVASAGWLLLVWAVYVAVGGGTRWLGVAVFLGAFPFVALVRWLVWRRQSAAIEGSDGEP